MSNLRLKNDDDHPEAARKHLLDAAVLLNASRADGAAYLAGYVVECSLKTLILLERGVPARSTWKGANGHNLQKLHSDVSKLKTLAGAKAARYITAIVKNIPSAAIVAWTPEMRYHAPSIAKAQATTWLDEARSVYQETVEKMMLDGII